MDERAKRAAQRKASWEGSVVRLGEPKPAAYDSLSLEMRLVAYADLNLRSWLAAGNAPPESLSRDQWPGEILDLRPESHTQSHD